MDDRSRCLTMQIQEICKKMAKTNRRFHFFRNSPRSTNYYYQRLIGVFGSEEWKRINPDVRTTWVNAKSDFDKMFGLIKAWNETDCEKLFYVPEKEEDKSTTETSSLNEENLEKIEEKLKELNKAIDNCMKGLCEFRGIPFEKFDSLCKSGIASNQKPKEETDRESAAEKTIIELDNMRIKVNMLSSAAALIATIKE